MKLLLIEDDPVLGELMERFLAQHYEVTRLFSGDEAYTLMDEMHFDLLVLDINLPGESGIAFLKQLRSFGDNTPALFVTAYDDTAHLKAAFDAGAHDYIKKPFELEELHLRIKKSRQLFVIESETPVRIDETTTYIPKKRLLKIKDETILLRPKEAEILRYLMAHAGRVVTHEELLHNLWHFEQMPSDATLRSYIRSLRQLLGKARIQTVRGSGYRYERA